jgi:hypothetical protein
MLLIGGGVILIFLIIILLFFATNVFGNKNIDGGWSDWITGSCNTKCGSGKKTLSRTCTNPSPEYDGKKCIGDDKKTQDCKLKDCPIDGGWSNWKKFGSCTTKCAGGILLHKRTCDNPKPEFGGSVCTGDSIKKVACNTQKCPVHGGWGPWKPNSTCNKTCGGGILKLERTCNDPKPRFGGNQCTGSNIKDLQCNTQKCLIKARYVTIGCKNMLNLLQMQVFNEKNVNVALNKRVTSSSIYNRHYKGYRLVDNKLNTMAHTQHKKWNWFIIDLGKEMDITRVVVYNRRNCCRERINTSQIFLSDARKKIIYTSRHLFGSKLKYTINPNTNKITF